MKIIRDVIAKLRKCNVYKSNDQWHKLCNELVDQLGQVLPATITSDPDFKNPTGGWGHRIIEHTILDGHGGTQKWYAIHEVFYNEDGNGWTANPVPPGEESIEELKQSLEWMLEAISFPVIIDTTPIKICNQCIYWLDSKECYGAQAERSEDGMWKTAYKHRPACIRFRDKTEEIDIKCTNCFDSCMITIESDDDNDSIEEYMRKHIPCPECQTNENTE